MPPHPSRTTGTPTTSPGRAGARHAPCCTRRPGSADPREGDDPSSPASALLPIPSPQHNSSRSASLRRRLEPRIARFEISGEKDGSCHDSDLNMLAKARKPSRSQVQLPASTTTPSVSFSCQDHDAEGMEQRQRRGGARKKDGYRTTPMTMATSSKSPPPATPKVDARG